MKNRTQTPIFDNNDIYIYISWQDETFTNDNMQMRLDTIFKLYTTPMKMIRQEVKQTFVRLILIGSRSLVPSIDKFWFGAKAFQNCCNKKNLIQRFNFDSSGHILMKDLYKFDS